MRGVWLTGVCASALLLGAAPARAQVANPGQGSNPVAQAGRNTPGPVAQTSPKNGQQGATLEEVVVTAQKRSQRLNDVPAAVSAITGAELDRQGAHNLSDFAAQIPSLNFSGNGPGAQTLSIRGINTGSEPSPLVGVVLDGVPYGSSSSFAFGGLLALDAALWDTNRVEVLRGPQGTLYGASSMGGLVSYVYRNPSLTTYEGAAEGEVSSTDGGGLNYVTRAAIGGPIVTDKLGFRLSVSHQDDDGFLNDSLLHLKHINDLQITNVRGSLLFQPNDDLKIQFSTIYQKLDRGSSDGVIYDRATASPAAGDLDQYRARTEPESLEFGQGALNVDYDLGWATLDSITGYQVVSLSQDADFTATPTGSVLTGLFGAATTALDANAETKKTTEELRLTSLSGQRLTWLLGFFFDDESSTNQQTIFGDLANGQPSPLLDPGLTISLPSHYREYAGFGQLTYAITPRFDISGGIRYSYDQQDFLQTNKGPLAAFSAPDIPLTHSSEDQVSYLGTLRYHLTHDQTAYFRVASGYRPGGPNVVIPGAGASVLPPTFKSDTLVNYEIGYKARLWEGRADVQLAGFYIDWSNIQITAATGGFSGRANGGSATSKGFEASGTVRPIPPVTLGYSFACVDAQLSDAIPTIGARAGERLPNTAKFSGSVFAEYRQPLSDRWSGVARASFRGMSDRRASFDGSAGNPQFNLKPYGLVDLRLGVESDRYALTAFIRNVGNERAEYSAAGSELTVTNQELVTIARPRTFGIMASANF